MIQFFIVSLHKNVILYINVMVRDYRNEIKNTVLHKRPDAKVYLFGSRARGTERLNSDWDVIVVVNENTISPAVFAEIGNPLYDLAIDRDIEINPIIYTEKQWNNQHPTLFKHNLETEAIRL